MTKGPTIDDTSFQKFCYVSPLVLPKIPLTEKQSMIYYALKDHTTKEAAELLNMSYSTLTSADVNIRRKGWT